jgi:hypothetical protein
LHDLGKLAVPEHILNKPGKLTPVEFDQMKTHAEIGADILSTIDFPYAVEPIVRYHHEMWDGKGYPAGISGEAIPIGARILSVVDCFDALTSDRPYRRALTKDQAIAVLVERRGTHYDPRVVDTFIAVCDRLIDASHSLAREEAESGREAEIRDIVAPRLPAGVEPSTDDGDDADAPFDHQGWAAQSRGDRGALPTYGVIVQYLKSVAPGAVAVLFRYDAEQAKLVATRASSEHEFLLGDLSMPLGDRLTGWVGANRQTILNSDPGLDLGDLAEAWVPQLQSCFAMPLVVDEDLAGVLTVYSPDVRGLSKRQSATLALLVKEGLEPMSAAEFEPVLDAPPLTLAAPGPGPRRVTRGPARVVSMPA